MKRARKNKRFKGITSKDGKELIIRGSLLEMILPEPSPRKKPSPLQRESNERFRAASQYASKQINDPESKAEYEAGIRPNKHTAYNVALTDYLNPPKIVYINTKKYSGKVGDLILLLKKNLKKKIKKKIYIFFSTYIYKGKEKNVVFLSLNFL